MPGCTNVPLADHSKAFLPGIEVRSESIDDLRVLVEQILPFADVSIQVEKKLCVAVLDIFPLSIPNRQCPFASAHAPNHSVNPMTMKKSLFTRRIATILIP